MLNSRLLVIRRNLFQNPLSRCIRLYTTNQSPPPTSAPEVGDNTLVFEEMNNKTADELAVLKNSYLTVLADMENLRTRTRREIEAAGQFAIKRFAIDVLSISDVLHMALQGPGESATTESLRDGMELTLKEAEAVLKRNGVEEVAALNEKFDPNLHEALFEVPGTEDGRIAMVQKRGFTLNGRILRPAQVGITKRQQ